MLGDLIYKANGKVAGYRVLDAEGPKIEVTITEKGTLKGGIETTDTGVFPDSEGHIMLKAKEF
jgi:hypothetical protein